MAKELYNKKEIVAPKKKPKKKLKDVFFLGGKGKKLMGTQKRKRRKY